MPLIQVNMLEGRTAQQKQALLAAITDAVHESIGAEVASIRVWIHELSPEHLMAAGVTAAERRRQGEQP